MAISIAYGLAIATFITLLLLPIALVLLNRVKVYLLYLWTGTKPTNESVEPAIQEKHADYEEI